MEFGLGPIIGVIKKIPLIFNKVELSIDINSNFNEIIYIIKNNGKKNINNFSIIEYKEKNDLDFPTKLFDNFEKKYFCKYIGLWDDEYHPINFPEKFKNGKNTLIKNLNQANAPSSKIKLYCDFIETNLSLLLTMASVNIDSYYQYLMMVEDVRIKNIIMENQNFLDFERLSEKAVKLEEEKLKIIIKMYLENIIEFTNFIHFFSKNISINHNLDSLKKIFNSERHKQKMKCLVTSSDPNYDIDDLQFLKEILDNCKKELNIKPNDFLYFTRSKIIPNENVLIKKRIYDSIIFSIKFKNSDDEDIIIKDYSKKIEIKYEEFSVFLPWTKFINKEYKQGIKNNIITIKRLTWKRVEIIKKINLPEITENSSSLYDKFYR